MVDRFVYSLSRDRYCQGAPFGISPLSVANAVSGLVVAQRISENALSNRLPLFSVLTGQTFACFCYYVVLLLCINDKYMCAICHFHLVV
ncbi:hypothetical protein V1505DRAFT_25706 [Lipomyces doorenjongii]